MARGGKKYRLLLYEHLLDGWWPTAITLSLAIFIYVGALWGAAWYFNAPGENPLPVLSEESTTILLVTGVIVFVLGVVLMILRKMAYAQLFSDHMKIATPFLRLNISYKRIQLTTTTQVSNLFPPKSMSGRKREIIAPISDHTAIIVHLKSYPLPRAMLKLFLSPFFFYDKTPHLVLMVDDWMGFSGELESRRVSGKMPPRKGRAARITSGLLDDLHKK